MPQNMGVWDRGVRVVLGVLLLGLYGAIEPPFRYFTLLGLGLIASAIVGRCPLYSALGVSTRK